MKRAEDNGNTTTYKRELNHLKRKLDDLEEVHRNGKKQHTAEVERLKADHEHTRKANKEQAEQIARLKRDNELAKVRMQELKKTISTTQKEAGELRAKLLSIETERDKLVGRQTDTDDLRTALRISEQRRKDMIEQRENLILQIQDGVAAEKKRRLDAEAKAKEQRTELEKETRDVRVKNTLFEKRLEQLQAQLKRLESEKFVMDQELSSTSQALSKRVTELEETLKLATEQYGQLSSSSTSSSVVEELKLEAARLQLNVARLEKKLANSEEQVYELTQFIRREQATNNLLSEQLQDANTELEWRSNESKFTALPSTSTPDDGLRSEVDEFLLAESRRKVEEQAVLLSIAQNQLRLNQENNKSLVDHLSSTERQLADERAEATRLKNKLADKDTVITKLSHESDSRKKECDDLQKKLATQSSEIFSLQTKLTEAEKRIVEAESRARTELAKREELLRKERELTTRLQSNVHKSKMAEDALKDEIEQLTSELASADAYREAYQTIAEEMRGLVARNDLAEDEANRLSQFNAEILSHRNPTQKILYVDRIRRELAETKQKLALSDRDNESAQCEIETLRGELAMYKSVTVPFEGKPRTAMTRVRRIPLSTQKRNIQAEVVQEDSEVHAYSDGYSRPGDMTMDELR